MASSLRNLLPTGLLIIGIVLVEASDINSKVPTSFRLVSRWKWSARPPIKPASPLKILPASYVVISHTATEVCHTESQCKSIVLSIQNFHMKEKGWDDIAYNFLIGGDGNVYEGRGWDVQGSHTKNYNGKSIGLSFIGTFNKEKPTGEQLKAAEKLLKYGLKNGKTSKDYKLLGHRQCTNTDSPGEVLYNIIKTWDHWSPIP